MAKKNTKKSNPAPTTEPTPAPTPEVATNEATLEALAECYLEHLADIGKSQGTVLSYRMELVTALSELGRETLVAELTPDRVLEFFVSDRVTKTRTGVLKARVSVLKTQRVLRQALVWAAEKGLVEKAPLPEEAATY